MPEVCWAFARAYAPDVLQPYVEDLAKALIQAQADASLGSDGGCWDQCGQYVM